MIAKIGLLLTSAFSLLFTYGTIKEAKALHDNRNAITEDNGITSLNFELGLIVDTSNTPTAEDVYGSINVKILEDFNLQYTLQLYDSQDTVLFDASSSFNASRWNTLGLSNVKLKLTFYSDSDLYNPGNDVDTIAWVEYDDFGDGYDSGTNLFFNQYQSTIFEDYRIDNTYYFVLPMDLIYSFFENGWNSSYTRGYNEGLSDGSEVGYNNGFSEGSAIGFQNGFNAGQQNSIQFMGLFGAIADTPILMIRSLFSFELFGVSTLAIFMTLLTALIVIHFIRKVI